MICRTVDIFLVDFKYMEEELARKNWLPAPKTEEHFSLALRVYTPDEQTIRGEWEPPVLERI